MADDFQYVKLPDGSYGKFAKGASDAQIRATVAKHFPSAYKSTTAAAPASTSVKNDVIKSPTDSDKNTSQMTRGAEQQYQPMDTKPPENARFPQLGRTGYKAADFIANMLPGAGATIGGMNVETGPAAVGLAAAGGAIGDRAQHYLNRLLYKDLPPQSAKDAIISMGENAALGAGSEFGARGAKTVLSKMLTPFAKSAESVKAAEAGTGIRLTPGEASGSKLMQRGETVIEHLLPGGAGPLDKFRVAQEGDVIKTLDKQLNALSSRGLSPEEMGKQVQQTIKKAEADAIQSQNAYGEVKTLLGLKPTATKQEIEAALEAGEKPSSILDANGRPIPGRSMSAARSKLAQASKMFADEQNRVQTDIVGKILSTQKPEIIGTYFEKAGLNELRQLQTTLPQPVKQDVARNVLENMISRSSDAQSDQVGARKLAVGLKQMGEGRGRLIFGQQYDAIREASALMNRIAAPPSNTIMGRMHAARMLGSAAVALGGLFGFGGLEHAVTAVGGEALFSRMLSLALTHPGTTAGALKILRATAVTAARGTAYVPGAFNEVFTPSPARYALEAPQP